MRRVLALAIVASAGTARADDGPAYQLQPEFDAPAIAASTALTLSWFFSDLGPAWCAPQCEPSQLNPIDRPFAGRYHPAWTTAGTLAAAGLLAAPPFVLLAAEGARHAANDTVVLVESALVSSAVAGVVEMAVRRPRPFLYGTSAPLSDRNDTSASLSFYSGHTTLSFAATFATWRTLERLHVSARWRWTVFGIGLAGATFVAVSRVVAGDHFPTDVAAGAIAGASIGTIIPALHRRGVHVTPTGVVGTF